MSENVFNDDFGSVLEANRRRAERQEQGLYDEGEGGGLKAANDLLTQQVQEATQGDLKIDPNASLGQRASRAISNRFRGSGQQFREGLGKLATPPSVGGSVQNMPTMGGGLSMNQMKGVWDTVMGGFDFIYPFSAAAGRVAKEVMMTPGVPNIMPGPVGIAQGAGLVPAPKQEELAEAVGTGVEIVTGLGGTAPVRRGIKAAGAGVTALASKFGGKVNAARMEQQVGATFEAIAPHLKPEQKAKVAAYLTSPGHNEDLFSDAKAAMEGALRVVNPQGDAKQAANVLSDVLRGAKSRIAQPPPGPGAIDNTDNIILHGAEARLDQGGAGPYPNVMPDPSVVSEAKVASLTRIAEGATETPLQYGKLHRALDTLHTYMQSQGIEVNPMSSPPRGPSNPMSITGPSGVSYGDILEAARTHWGGKGDPDTGWYLLRQVFDQGDDELLRVLDHEVLLGGEEAVARQIAGPQVRETMGPGNLTTIRASRAGTPDETAAFMALEPTDAGYMVSRLETTEAARGRGLARLLHRTAFERYGPYQGAHEGLTAEGRGLQQRLMRTDPDIYGHQPGEILPHTLDDIHQAVVNPEIGGATIDPRTGEAVARDSGYSVSVAPEREVSIPKGQFSYRDMQKFLRENQDALGIEGAQFGLWEDGGKVFMDISKTVEDLNLAKAEAQLYGQYGIWDWKNKQTIRMDGTPKRGENLPPMRERFLPPKTTPEAVTANPESFAKKVAPLLARTAVGAATGAASGEDAQDSTIRALVFGAAIGALSPKLASKRGFNAFMFNPMVDTAKMAQGGKALRDELNKASYYGASMLYQFGDKVPTWTREMKKFYGEALDAPQLKVVYDKAQQVLKQIEKTFQGPITPVGEKKKFYERGSELMGDKSWYAPVRESFAGIMGKNHLEKFTAFYAANSSGNNTPSTITLARKTFKQYMEGQTPLTGGRFTAKKYLEDLGKADAYEEFDALMGQKHGNFFGNLLSNLELITHDEVEKLSFGARPRKQFNRKMNREEMVVPAPSVVESRFMDVTTRSMAQQRGVQPAIYQERNWTGYKEQMERAGDPRSPAELYPKMLADEIEAGTVPFELQLAVREGRDLDLGSHGKWTIENGRPARLDQEK